MNVRDIVKYGDPKLDIESAEVKTFGTGALQALIDDMFTTMYAYQGVGLAAPQIGINRKIAVVDVKSGKDEDAKIVLINPRIDKYSDAKVELTEGCLSIPGMHGKLKRSKEIMVTAQKASGEEFTMGASGYLAQAIQHEVDHLNGILYIRHTSPLYRNLILRKIRNLTKKGQW